MPRKSKCATQNMTKKDLEKKVEQLELELSIVKLELEVLKKYPTIYPLPYIPPPFEPFYPPIQPYIAPYVPTKIWYSSDTIDIES
jgi:hypothetical protein